MSDDGARIGDAMVLLIMRSTRQQLHEEITRGVHPAVDVVSYPILSAIDRVGPINSSRLGPTVGLDRSFVSRLADRLIGAGLLRRQADPSDRRVTLLALSDEGEQVVGVLRQRLTAAIEQMLEDWPAAERHSLAELMTRFVAELNSGRRWAAADLSDRAATQQRRQDDG